MSFARASGLILVLSSACAAEAPPYRPGVAEPPPIASSIPLAQDPSSGFVPAHAPEMASRPLFPSSSLRTWIAVIAPIDTFGPTGVASMDGDGDLRLTIDIDAAPGRYPVALARPPANCVHLPGGSEQIGAVEVGIDGHGRLLLDYRGPPLEGLEVRPILLYQPSGRHLAACGPFQLIETAPSSEPLSQL
jgi:hypothetical protein